MSDEANVEDVNDRSLHTLRARMDDLQADVSGAHARVGDLQARIGDLRALHGAFQARVRDLQAKVVDHLNGVDLVRAGVGVFREEVDERFDRMHDKMRVLEIELRGEMKELRGDMQARFKASKKQNDRRFLEHEARLRALERRR